MLITSSEIFRVMKLLPNPNDLFMGKVFSCLVILSEPGQPLHWGLIKFIKIEEADGTHREFKGALDIESSAKGN